MMITVSCCEGLCASCVSFASSYSCRLDFVVSGVVVLVAACSGHGGGHGGLCQNSCRCGLPWRRSRHLGSGRHRRAASGVVVDVFVIVIVVVTLVVAVVVVVVVVYIALSSSSSYPSWSSFTLPRSTVVVVVACGAPASDCSAVLRAPKSGALLFFTKPDRLLHRKSQFPPPS